MNTTEFDPVNSFHLHANFFDYYDTGRAANRLEMVDTIMQCQAQRGILQMRMPHPGPIMFHAHQSEFAELGWLAFFDVQPTAGGSPGGDDSGSPQETVEEVKDRITGEDPSRPTEPSGSPTTETAATDQATGSTGARAGTTEDSAVRTAADTTKKTASGATDATGEVIP